MWVNDCRPVSVGQIANSQRILAFGSSKRLRHLDQASWIGLSLFRPGYRDERGIKLRSLRAVRISHDGG